MKRYLTGGSGFLGSNLIRVAREDYGWAVVTTVNAWRASAPVDCAYEHVDSGEREAVLHSVQQSQLDAIAHSAILNDVDRLYRDRALAWRLYVEATSHLTDAANAAGCTRVLISTDWVFDGPQLEADAAPPPNPVNDDGVLKVAGARVVVERAPNGAVARVAGVNGVHWLRPEGGTDAERRLWLPRGRRRGHLAPRRQGGRLERAAAAPQQAHHALAGQRIGPHSPAPHRAGPARHRPLHGRRGDRA